MNMKVSFGVAYALLTEMRDVCLIAERAVVEVFHPILPQCFSLGEWLTNMTGLSRVCGRIIIKLTTSTPSAGIKRGYGVRNSHK